MSNVHVHVAAVQERMRQAALRAGRDPETITLVAVTKTLPAERVQEAVASGIRHLGENRVQEAKAKKPLVAGDAAWHLIGHLQTNKAKQAVQLFDWVHSLDRPDLAEELHRRALAEGRRLPVLVQVNVAREASKSGVDPDNLVSLVRLAARLDGLEVRGLMTIAPLVPDPEEVRLVFRRLAQMAGELRQLAVDGVRMEHLSMGMSGDFEVAIEEGATMVRLGTALFGERVGAKPQT
ncbi:MAG: YggS family pyridoxal phosphate-dependent enzyme [Firmicutes bacterium]|nr:YggS family pyridoxal phosphate-dependent enzyme [Bacillota bacterium]